MKNIVDKFINNIFSRLINQTLVRFDEYKIAETERQRDAGVSIIDNFIHFSAPSRLPASAFKLRLGLIGYEK